MAHRFLTAVFASCLLTTVVGNMGELEIVEMRVPLVVETGTTPSVVLDCDYVLRRADKRSELVVQWYFANQTTPVYQWIPGKRPQDLGVLKGRLNLDYRASSDDYKRHRALQILRPTSDLSGRYRCKVATVEKEVVAARNMIVYTPVQSFNIWHKKTTVNQTTPLDAVNVTCQAKGVSPRPRLQLFLGDNPGKVIESGAYDGDVVVDEQAGGLFDVTLHRVVVDETLPQETVFKCVLSIPDTQYQISRKGIYFPGRAPQQNAGSSNRKEAEVEVLQYVLLLAVAILRCAAA